MRIIAIMLKDLKQILQEKRSLMFLVAMPIVFTLFMGFAYSKSQGDPNVDTRLALAWVDQDNGDVLGKRLETMLSNSESVRLEAMEEIFGSRVASARASWPGHCSSRPGSARTGLGEGRVNSPWW